MLGNMMCRGAAAVVMWMWMWMCKWMWMWWTSQSVMLDIGVGYFFRSSWPLSFFFRYRYGGTGTVQSYGDVRPVPDPARAGTNTGLKTLNV